MPPGVEQGGTEIPLCPPSPAKTSGAVQNSMGSFSLGRLASCPPLCGSSLSAEQTLNACRRRSFYERQSRAPSQVWGSCQDFFVCMEALKGVIIHFV